MLYQFQAYCKVNYLYMYIYPFFFRFFSHIGHYQVLSRVPWAIQQVLIRCLFSIEYCACVNLNLPICPPPTKKFTHFNLCYKILHTQDPPTIPVLPDTFLSCVYYTVTKWKSQSFPHLEPTWSLIHLSPGWEMFSQSHISGFNFSITP